MKVGIVVAYSISLWGGVVEHAEEQARALSDLGVETRVLIGHDPPGRRLLVAPSLGRESFGTVLTRAFASATPVVASNIDGYRQLVAERYGRLVERRDEADLDQATITLLEDEPLRRQYASTARRLVMERYAWPKIAERLQMVYEQLVDGCWL